MFVNGWTGSFSIVLARGQRGETSSASAHINQLYDPMLMCHEMDQYGMWYVHSHFLFFLLSHALLTLTLLLKLASDKAMLQTALHDRFPLRIIHL